MQKNGEESFDWYQTYEGPLKGVLAPYLHDTTNLKF